MRGKWLEIAKDLAPHITRVLLIYHPETTPHDQFVQSVETAAPALGLNLAAIGVNDAAGIEHAFDDFSPKSDSALIVFPAVVTGTYRQLIIELATRLRMPAVYPFRYFVVIGGLAFPDPPRSWFRRAAFYIDRILKGEKPANLPVQQPTKFELVINLKTAKALGLNVPAAFARPRRRGDRVRRREVVLGLTAAAGWPSSARAEQRSSRALACLS